VYLSADHTVPLRKKQQRTVITSPAHLSLLVVEVWYGRQNYLCNNIAEDGSGASFQWTLEPAFLWFLCKLRKFLALERRCFLLNTLALLRVW